MHGQCLPSGVREIARQLDRSPSTITPGVHGGDLLSFLDRQIASRERTQVGRWPPPLRGTTATQPPARHQPLYWLPRWRSHERSPQPLSILAPRHRRPTGDRMGGLPARYERRHLRSPIATPHGRGVAMTS